MVTLGHQADRTRHSFPDFQAPRQRKNLLLQNFALISERNTIQQGGDLLGKVLRKAKRTATDFRGEVEANSKLAPSVETGFQRNNCGTPLALWWP